MVQEEVQVKQVYEFFNETRSLGLADWQPILPRSLSISEIDGTPSNSAKEVSQDDAITLSVLCEVSRWLENAINAKSLPKRFNW